MCSSFVYIVSSRTSGQFYIGLTPNLVERVWQHRSGQFETAGIPSECHKLVWYRTFDKFDQAKTELERLSLWPEAWLTRLIIEDNPEQADLWTNLEDQPRITLGAGYRSTVPQSTTSRAYPVLRPFLKVA